ncbi:unnamed protein product [Mytilus coruscus]|uniref:Tyr recombinase domain-containing protein n=1 Tax=Mytilus coruscus TaxID=42192 RepID=A0A6J8EXR6_MYTCO|nr:unnamed protein product [Mytilus coruscus]
MSLFVKLHQHLQEKYLETTNTRLDKEHKPAQDLAPVSTTRMTTSPVHNQQTGAITAMTRVRLTGPITAQRDVGSNQPRPVVLQEQSDEIVTASKSENTLKKYKGYFKRFKYWCLKYNLSFLPTTVCTVAIYLNYLIQSGVSTAVLNAAYYSIKWEHDLNLYDSILNDKILDMVLEGGIRLLSKSLKRKEPITPTILKSIIAKFDKNDNLPGLRICALMLLGFSGFLRYDELAHIRSSDLTFNDSHLQINIQKNQPNTVKTSGLPRKRRLKGVLQIEQRAEGYWWWSTAEKLSLAIERTIDLCKDSASFKGLEGVESLTTQQHCQRSATNSQDLFDTPPSQPFSLPGSDSNHQPLPLLPAANIQVQQLQ